MIFLRFLSFLIGIGIPMALPLVMSDVGTRGMPGRPVVVGLIGLGLVSGSFLYVALLAPRMRRSLMLRILGGVLLMLPLMASLAVLWTRTQETMLLGGGMLLLASALMFVSFIYPATPDRRQRPMRARDRQEPALP